MDWMNGFVDWMDRWWVLGLDGWVVGGSLEK